MKCTHSSRMARCTVCDGVMHAPDCSTRLSGKLNLKKDCCPDRHRMLFEAGQTFGIYDTSQPMWDGQFSDHESSMTEHAVRIPMGPMRALRIIADAINNPDLLHDMVYHAFQAQVPDWAEHGWELHAVAGMAEVIVTARRKA